MTFAAPTQVIVITGASRGIGKVIAEHLASKENYRVYAGYRSVDSIKVLKERLFAIPIDVQDNSSCQNAINMVLSREGHIDVLINNAGCGILGPVETVTMEQVHKIFNTNVYGAIRMIQAVLPNMRAQKSGKIINVSSVAGLQGLACWDMYCSSKFALEGLSESMALTLAPFNIHISMIEPGPVVSDFMDHSTEVGNRNMMSNPYQILVKNRLNQLCKSLNEGQDPKEVALLTEEIIQSPTPHFRNLTNEAAKDRVKKKYNDLNFDNIITEGIIHITPLWSEDFKN